MWLLTGTGVLHRTMDRTIVGIILGPSAVALVEVATQIQNGVSAAMSASSFSVISSSAFVRGSGDQHRLRELLVRATRYTCLATLPLSALVALLAVQTRPGQDRAQPNNLTRQRDQDRRTDRVQFLRHG